VDTALSVIFGTEDAESLTSSLILGKNDVTFQQEFILCTAI
jgi:hypothetical protein